MLLFTIASKVANKVAYDGMYGLGKLENAISPEAFIGFCHQNGFTVWKGDGPAPNDENAYETAWKTYGTMTGFAVGLWLPGGLMTAKCDAAGWGKPEDTPAKPTNNNDANRPTTHLIGGGTPTQTTYTIDQFGRYVDSNGRLIDINTFNQPSQITINQVQPQPNQGQVTILRQPTQPQTGQVTILRQPSQPQTSQVTISRQPQSQTSQVTISRQPGQQPPQQITVTVITNDGKTYLLDPTGNTYCPCSS